MFGVLCQEMECPGKAQRRRLVSGRDEGHEVIDDFAVAHATAALRIGGGEQHRYEVVTGIGRNPALGDDPGEA